MKNLLYISTLVVLGACGYSEEKFADDFVESYCAAWDTCNTAGADCPVTASEGDSTELPEGCEYDSKQAKECTKGEFGCDDSLGEGLEFVTAPAACETVVVCE